MVFVATAGLAAALANAPCTGADPAIRSVAVTNVADENGVNHYTLGVTVINLGTKGQAANVLQSIDIYRNGVKADAKGVPPLRAGQIFHFSYVVTRSDEGATGSTPVRFVLHVHQPSPPGAQECNAANDSYAIDI